MDPIPIDPEPLPFTNLPKLGHSDARGTAIDASGLPDIEGFLTTSSLSNAWKDRNGRKTSCPSQPTTHTLSKQIFWPVEDDFVLLGVLPSVALAYELHNRIWTDRMDSDQKESRKARREGKPHTTPHVEPVGLMVRNVGGANPINVGLTVAKMRGEFQLLPGLPPTPKPAPRPRSKGWDEMILAGETEYPESLVKSTRRGMETPEMLALRELVWQRDPPVCYLCKRSVTKDSWNLEHVKPRKHFPHEAFNPENLRISCGPCNDDKRNRTGLDGRLICTQRA